MVVDVLRGDFTTMSSFTCQPGVWGVAGFNAFSFQYDGDGSGPVLIRISPLAASGHFGGAIDNLRVATDFIPSVPPEITLQPVGGTVTEGDDFVFSVQGSGLPSYQWTKDGKPIQGATNATYLISDVRTNDTGSYAVVLSNGAGSVTSSPAVLEVTPSTGYPTYTETLLADNPIHYYPLDETEGAVAADVGTLATSGGTYLGGFTLAQPSSSSQLGHAVRMDGADGTLVDLGVFHPGDSVTAEAWVLIDEDAIKPWTAVMARWDGSYEIAVNSDLGVSFAVRNDANMLGQSFSVSSPQRGQWHHMVGVYSDGTATIYVDGVKGRPQTIGGPLRDGGPTPDRVMIGSTRDGMGGSSFNLKGAIDEVAIYDTALSLPQIRAHYRSGRPPVSPSLSIAPNGGVAVVAWPSSATGYALQVAGNINGPYDNYTGNIVTRITTSPLKCRSGRDRSSSG